MRTHTLASLVATFCVTAALAENSGEVVILDTSAPRAIDIGEGPHYYGVQSIVGTTWYPRSTTEEECTAVGDYFTMSRSGHLTSVTFWGRLMDYGTGPGEIHVFVLSLGPDGPKQRYHAWTNEIYDWSAFSKGDVDPSGLGTECVRQWEVRITDLPRQEGTRNLVPGSYLLVIAGDDGASEFVWSVNPPDGIVVTSGPQLYVSGSSDYANTPLTWSPADLGQGPHANNLAFCLTGVVSMAPDFDEDGDVDQSDFGHMQHCLTLAAAPECETADLDGSEKIDAGDVLIFQSGMTGPVATTP